MLLGITFVGDEAKGSPGESTNANAVPKKWELVLHFPAAPSVGGLSVREKSAWTAQSTRQWYEGWRDIGEARGEVRIPPDVDLWLSVSKEGGRDLSFLTRLTNAPIRILNLRYTDVADEQLKHLAGLQTLKELDLAGTEIGDAGLKCLSSLAELEGLDLFRCPVTDAGLAEIVGLMHLRRLDLLNTRITDEGLSHLKRMQALQELRFPDTEVTDDGLRHLVPLRSLRYVEVSHRITDRGITFLAQIPSLRRIYFSDSDSDPPRITKAGLAQLAKMKALEELDLVGKGITDEGLAEVARLPRLRGIWLQLCPVTDRGLAALASAKSLEWVRLNGTDVTGEGLRHLAALPNLTELSVKDVRRGRLDLKHIGQFKSLVRLEIRSNEPRNAYPSFLRDMTRLTDLSLSGPPMKDEDLALVAGLRSLEHLTLEDVQVTDEGLGRLAGLTRLKSITIGSRTVSQEGLEELQRKLSGLKSISKAPFRGMSKRPKVGQVAPDFEVKTLEGRTFRLNDQRGKAVLLHFWATWCAVCVKNNPDVVRLHQELSAGHKQFTIISLSLDMDPDRLRRYLEKNRLPWPQARISLDSQIGTDYGVVEVPEYYLIGPDGIITAEVLSLQDIRPALSKLPSN